jgi:hypothetical protein
MVSRIICDAVPLNHHTAYHHIPKLANEALEDLLSLYHTTSAPSSVPQTVLGYT